MRATPGSSSWRAPGIVAMRRSWSVRTSHSSSGSPLSSIAFNWRAVIWRTLWGPALVVVMGVDTLISRGAPLLLGAGRSFGRVDRFRTVEVTGEKVEARDQGHPIDGDERARVERARPETVGDTRGEVQEQAKARGFEAPAKSGADRTDELELEARQHD